MKRNILILLLGLVLAGCCSAPLPPVLTAEELASIRKQDAVEMIVAVNEYKYPVYSEELYKTLKTVDVVSEVIYLSDAHDKKVAYIAEVNRRIHGKATLWPVLTLVTVGIIPSWAEEENGISFMLRRMDDPSQITYVEVSWTGTTILGWAGLFAALWPDRTFFNPETSTRFYDRVRFETFKALRTAEKSKVEE